MEQVRWPVMAGSFYPSDPGRLRAMIRDFLREAGPVGPAPKAVIAPHAGYVYSGATAAWAYARLALGRARIRRVVLLGPAHRVLLRGMAVTAADGFATPLGVVPVDRAGVEAILDLPGVHLFEPAHAPEHSLEVQLPFLQEVLDDFRVVPVVVGEAADAAVEAVLDRLWGGDETVIVVSSDLSHYLAYGEARRMDQATSEAIAGLRPEGVEAFAACGCQPVRGLLLAARGHGLKGEVLDVRNSGDTAGGRDRVVGYGAYAFV